MMFNRLLIANRGEIACRIIATARRMGIHCVAVYSSADRNARHVAMADEAFWIGEAPARDSYLNMDAILEVARRCAAEAVHPGYGFLSENARFARRCRKQGLVFIGPSAQAIEQMGSKSAAKAIMARAGIPMLPGYHGEEQSLQRLQQEAEACGYPLLLKAVSGGGGKGMRVVRTPKELSAAIDAARREAAAAFDDDRLLLEKFLDRPRHVEVQVFADRHGNAIYLGDRDCSIQRRYQKVLEEAPAPDIPERVRRQMGETAVRAARAIDYEGAGTVEFLYAEDHFYFMEMNTRLQVEHPVTEQVTGQDLVAWQLRVAAGEALPLTQQEVRLQGHAIEARIYAENPAEGFLPASGTLAYLQTPEESAQVRIDSGVIEGDSIGIHYDPMIAKLICTGDSRDSALATLRAALADYRICGPATNLDFLKQLAALPALQAAELDTGFIERHRDRLLAAPQFDIERMLVLAACYLSLSSKRRYHNPADPHSPFDHLDNWRLNGDYHHPLQLIYRDREYALEIGEGPDGFIVRLNGHQYRVEAELDGHRLDACVNGHRSRVEVVPQEQRLTLFQRGYAFVCEQPLRDYDNPPEAGTGSLTAPMNGTLVALLKEPGEPVEAGEPLLVMEAMKMEHSISAPAAGRVSAYYFQPGQQVSEGAELLAFEPDQPAEEP